MLETTSFEAGLAWSPTDEPFVRACPVPEPSNHLMPDEPFIRVRRTLWLSGDVTTAKCLCHRGSGAPAVAIHFLLWPAATSSARSPSLKENLGTPRLLEPAGASRVFGKRLKSAMKKCRVAASDGMGVSEDERGEGRGRRKRIISPSWHGVARDTVMLMLGPGRAASGRRFCGPRG